MSERGHVGPEQDTSNLAGRTSAEAVRRGILVTGAHRSGTTWVGRMLCAGGELSYVGEPFNIVRDPTWLSPRPPVQFLYVCEDNAERWHRPVERVVRLRFPWWAQRSRPRAVAVQTLRAARHRLQGRRPLIKDPIAVFSAPWLARTFRLRPVLCVRHPLAFCGSILARRWSFDVSHWLSQPLLMRDLLSPWEDDLVSVARRPGDLVAQAAVTWSVIYGVVDRFRTEHPGWVVVRHEDLLADPVAGIGALHSTLGLAFGERSRAAVVATTSGGDPDGRDPIDIRRPARALADSWRRRLEPEAVDRIRRLTEEPAAAFYDPSEWP